jgi:hypothetical protein
MKRGGIILPKVPVTAFEGFSGFGMESTRPGGDGGLDGGAGPEKGKNALLGRKVGDAAAGARVVMPRPLR